jgi:deoxyribonuclease-4
MVRFGVAGYPPAFKDSKYKSNRIEIIDWIAELGLDAFEIQMTYGPRTKPETCLAYKERAEKFGVHLSVHASYFITFTGDNDARIRQSIDTLKKTYELADILGTDKIVLHPGPLGQFNNDQVKKNITRNLERFFNEIGKTNIGLFLETAGKLGQYGSIEEILEVALMFDQCFACVDFGHVHARTLGSLDNNIGIDSLFIRIDEYLAKRSGNRIHFHYTPINFGNRGELSHKALEDCYPLDTQLTLGGVLDMTKPKSGHYHPRFERIVDNIVRLKIDCTVISETHDSQERGALAMSRYYASIT